MRNCAKRPSQKCVKASNLWAWHFSECSLAISLGPKAIRSIFCTRAKSQWSRILATHAAWKILPKHRHHLASPAFELIRGCPAFAEMARGTQGAGTVRRGDGWILAGFHERKNSAASRGCIAVAARAWR